MVIRTGRKLVKTIEGLERCLEGWLGMTIGRMARNGHQNDENDD